MIKHVIVPGRGLIEKEVEINENENYNNIAQPVQPVQQTRLSIEDIEDYLIYLDTKICMQELGLDSQLYEFL